MPGTASCAAPSEPRPISPAEGRTHPRALHAPAPQLAAQARPRAGCSDNADRRPCWGMLPMEQAAPAYAPQQRETPTLQCMSADPPTHQRHTHTHTYTDTHLPSAPIAHCLAQLLACLALRCQSFHSRCHFALASLPGTNPGATTPTALQAFLSPGPQGPQYHPSVLFIGRRAFLLPAVQPHEVDRGAHEHAIRVQSPPDCSAATKPTFCVVPIAHILFLDWTLHVLV